MEDLSWDRLDALVDTDPLKLRDIAFGLASERDEKTARLLRCCAVLKVELGQKRDELAELRTKAAAVAEEYERDPRPIASGAVARMLREWVGA